MPSGNNTLTVFEEVKQYVVTIPVGSYNKNNLCAVLSTVWTSYSLSSGNDYTFAVTYSTSSVGDTFKLTFTVSGNGGVQPRNTNSPFRQLGFLADSNKTFASNVFISTNAISLSYVLRAFIKSNCGGDSILWGFPTMYFKQNNFDLNSRKFTPTARILGYSRWSTPTINSST